MNTLTRRLRHHTAALLATMAALGGTIAAAPAPAATHGPFLHPVAVVPEANGARSVAINGDVAYVVHRGGFTTVDLSNPRTPVVTDRQLGFDVLLPDESIEVQDDVLMVQVTDPAKPCPLFSLTFHGCEIRLYDVTDPLHPVMLGALDHPAHNATCIDGCRYIYTTAAAILDATDPTNLQVARTAVEVLQGVHDITAAGPDRAYTTGSFAGAPAVRYLDVSDPVTPVIATSHEPQVGDQRGASPNKVRPLGSSDLVVATDSAVTFGDCDETVGLRILDASAIRRWEVTGKGEPSLDQLDYITWGEGFVPARRDIDCSMTIDAHPELDTGGGLAAVSNTQHGIGLLEFASDGSSSWQLREVALGPVGRPNGYESRSSVGVRWLDDTYLLSVDAERGLEVLMLQR